jgi:hypothetical protein
MRTDSQVLLGLGFSPPHSLALGIQRFVTPRERENGRAPHINGRKRAHRRGHAKTHLFENFPPIPHHSRRRPLLQIVLEILLVVIQNGHDSALKVLTVEHHVSLRRRHTSVLVSRLFLTLLNHPGLRISISIQIQASGWFSRGGPAHFNFNSNSSVRLIQSESSRPAHFNFNFNSNSSVRLIQSGRANEKTRGRNTSALRGFGAHNLHHAPLLELSPLDVLGSSSRLGDHRENDSANVLAGLGVLQLKKVGREVRGGLQRFLGV